MDDRMIHRRAIAIVAALLIVTGLSAASLAWEPEGDERSPSRESPMARGGDIGWHDVMRDITRERGVFREGESWAGSDWGDSGSSNGRGDAWGSERGSDRDHGH